MTAERPTVPAVLLRISEIHCFFDRSVDGARVRTLLSESTEWTRRGRAAWSVSLTPNVATDRTIFFSRATGSGGRRLSNWKPAVLLRISEIHCFIDG